MQVEKTVIDEEFQSKGTFSGSASAGNAEGKHAQPQLEEGGRLVGVFSFPASPDADGKRVIIEPRVEGRKISMGCYTPDAAQIPAGAVPPGAAREIDLGASTPVHARIPIAAAGAGFENEYRRQPRAYYRTCRSRSSLPRHHQRDRILCRVLVNREASSSCCGAR